MRNLFIVLILSFLACNPHETSNYIKHTINLKNDIGELSIMLPSNFDTAYSWTNYSDNNCNDYEMFRFADKRYSLLQENGFLYFKKPDSLYQLTISQNTYLKCKNNESKINKLTLDIYVDAKIKLYPNAEFIIKEIRKIGNKEFIVIGYKNVINNKDNYILEATTIINGEVVQCKFDCYNNNCVDFFRKMEICLNTILIK